MVCKFGKEEGFSRGREAEGEREGGKKSFVSSPRGGGGDGRSAIWFANLVKKKSFSRGGGGGGGERERKGEKKD